MFVGSSRFQSIPTGTGGIQWMTCRRSGKVAVRGPTQNDCQCAERIYTHVHDDMLKKATVDLTEVFTKKEGEG